MRLKLIFYKNINNYKEQRNKAFFHQLFFRKVFNKDERTELSLDIINGINVIVVKDRDLFSRLNSSIVGTGLDVDILTELKYIALMGSKPKFPRPLYGTKLVLIYYLKMIFSSAKLKTIITFVNELVAESWFQKYFKDLNRVNYLDLSFLFLSYMGNNVRLFFVNSIISAQTVQKLVSGDVKIMVLVNSEKKIKSIGQYNKIRIFKNMDVKCNLATKNIGRESEVITNDCNTAINIGFTIYPLAAKSGATNKLSIKIEFENAIKIDNLKVIVSINDNDHNKYVQQITFLERDKKIFIISFDNLSFIDGIYTCFCSLMIEKKYITKNIYPLYIKLGDNPSYNSTSPYYIPN